MLQFFGKKIGRGERDRYTFLGRGGRPGRWGGRSRSYIGRWRRERTVDEGVDTMGGCGDKGCKLSGSSVEASGGEEISGRDRDGEGSKWVGKMGGRMDKSGNDRRRGRKCKR